MNMILRRVLSMSFSGSILIVALLLCRGLWRNRISRRWQYYIWLIVILRLLLPFGVETDLLGRAWQAAGQVITQAAPSPGQAATDAADSAAASGGLERSHENTGHPEKDRAASRPDQNTGALLADDIWLVWLAAAVCMLIRKITIYQGFVRYIRAGSTPVSDMERLDCLCEIAEQAGVGGPVELCVHPLVSSPLLIGLLHPCIVLPDMNRSEEDFRYTVWHELTHHKRRDLIYKWLVQAAVCLHWFNPLVYLMSREITRACEFSCDEAVLEEIGCGRAEDYGRTLLNAMAAVGHYKEHLGAVTLSENKQLLKERLSAIMNFKKKSTAVRLLTGILTLCVLSGASFLSVSPAAAASDPAAGKAVIWLRNGKNAVPAQGEISARGGRYALMAEKYYEAGSLPLFQMAFCNLDEKAQGEWLDRIYADGELAFWGAAVHLLDEDSAPIRHLAETVYEDDDIVFFSTLANRMDETELELWLDRALEDGNWAFQSMLFDRLGRDDEFDERKDQEEKEWEAAQKAEYGAVGVTMDGKDYYYKGQLVHIFLDIRPNKSFYTLNMNPKGSVNLKIVRSADNKITGAAYMTEAEITELFDDEEEDWDGGREDPEEILDDGEGIVIPVDFKTIAAGKTVFLGEYALSEGDRICYDILAETGKGMQVGFAKPGDSHLDTTYYSVKNVRQGRDALECASSFQVKPPVKAGTYQLFLRATDGALGGVAGGVSIIPAKSA